MIIRLATPAEKNRFIRKNEIGAASDIGRRAKVEFRAVGDNAKRLRSRIVQPESESVVLVIRYSATLEDYVILDNNRSTGGGRCEIDARTIMGTRRPGRIKRRNRRIRRVHREERRLVRGGVSKNKRAVARLGKRRSVAEDEMDVGKLVSRRNG